MISASVCWWRSSTRRRATSMVPHRITGSPNGQASNWEPGTADARLSCPAGYCMDGEIVVAVTRSAGVLRPRPRGERAGAPARDALKGGDRPLVVDDVKHDRRLVGGGEDERRVKVRFGHVEPSPIHATAILQSPLIADAIAQPPPGYIASPGLPETEKKPSPSRSTAAGSCRLPAGPVSFDHRSGTSCQPASGRRRSAVLLGDRSGSSCHPPAAPYGRRTLTASSPMCCM